MIGDLIAIGFVIVISYMAIRSRIKSKKSGCACSSCSACVHKPIKNYSSNNKQTINK